MPKKNVQKSSPQHRHLKIKPIVNKNNNNINHIVN